MEPFFASLASFFDDYEPPPAGGAGGGGGGGVPQLGGGGGGVPQLGGGEPHGGRRRHQVPPATSFISSKVKTLIGTSGVLCPLPGLEKNLIA